MGSLFSYGEELIFETSEDEFLANQGGIAYFNLDTGTIQPITGIYQTNQGVLFVRSALTLPPTQPRT